MTPDEPPTPTTRDYSTVFEDPSYQSAFERSRLLPPSIIEVWARYIGSLAKLIESDSPVLADLGCGMGRFAIPMARELRLLNGSVIAIDKSASMLRKLQDKVSMCKLENVELLHADLTDFRTRSAIDIFFASEVFQVVTSVDDVLTCAASNAADLAVFVIRVSSYSQIRRITWLTLFDSALQLDLQRSTDIATLAAKLRVAGFSGPIDSFEVSEERTIPAQDFIRALEEKAFSILRMIPQPDYEVGLKRAREYYRGKREISLEVNTTCLTVWRE
jgi:precorrin-6B methylase 2